MDIYHVWCDKKGNMPDAEWIDHMKSFLNQLADEGRMMSYRITRCKMGFRSMDIPEWHIMMEFNDMAQLESAFKRVAPQQGQLEVKHRSFNQFAENLQHAYYRDWPDQL
jgi:hypothetical protein